MLKIVAAGVTALFLTASPLAYAQESSSRGVERLSASDFTALTDARINIVKAALQLTPDQEKLWPPVEDAIRARAKNRLTRLEAMAKRVAELRDHGFVDALRNRDPVAFMLRRSEALAQRSADLKKLAEAWQPLYQTLTADQKKRMAVLAIFVLRELRDGSEQHGIQIEDSEDGDED